MTTATSHAIQRAKLNAYRDWRKRLARLAAHDAKLPNGYNMSTLYAIAIYIADKGDNGYGCYPSLTTIGTYLDLDRKTVVKYRQALIGMGWFQVAGKRGKGYLLNIDTPTDTQIITWVSKVQAEVG
jgi:hypothetical protein